MKVFSSRQYLPPGAYPAPILYPLWRDLHRSQLYGWASPYHEYLKKSLQGKLPFEFSELAEADIAVLPFDWQQVRGDSWHDRPNREAAALALAFAQTVAAAEKPLAVFFGSDCSDEPVDLPPYLLQNATIFRQSSYRSRPHLAHDPVLPFFCEDFVQDYATQDYAQGQLCLRPKQTRPVVGFCGFARPLNLKRRLQAIVYRGYMHARQRQVIGSPYAGEALRIQALQSLQDSEGVETRFIIRDRSVFFSASTYQDKQRVRAEYVDNLFQSDYVLCCRGSGNYSNRLYEVLSCGRIPILINTDCRLPWENQINWRDYCVWVEEDDLDSIAEQVADFHQRLSAKAFLDLQYRCRQLWLEWLSPQGYFSKFHYFFHSSYSQELFAHV